MVILLKGQHSIILYCLLHVIVLWPCVPPCWYCCEFRSKCNAFASQCLRSSFPCTWSNQMRVLSIAYPCKGIYAGRDGRQLLHYATLCTCMMLPTHVLTSTFEGATDCLKEISLKEIITPYPHIRNFAERFQPNQGHPWKY